MVNLTRITTKTGDGGTTRLASGDTVAKTDPRLEAGGDVDETNAAIGVALAAGLSAPSATLLQTVQNDLFDLGADLSVPLSAVVPGGGPLRITGAQIAAVEAAVESANEALPPLRSFLLPGGTPQAAQLHVARTVCRRAERRCWALVEAAGADQVNPQVPVYLNRLSDLLFVLSRVEAAGADILWEPGGSTAT